MSQINYLQIVPPDEVVESGLIRYGFNPHVKQLKKTERIKLEAEIRLAFVTKMSEMLNKMRIVNLNITKIGSKTQKGIGIMMANQMDIRDLERIFETALTESLRKYFKRKPIKSWKITSVKTNKPYESQSSQHMAEPRRGERRPGSTRANIKNPGKAK